MNNYKENAQVASDKEFTDWYSNKDFTVLEQMSRDKHREYYCRSAWFQRENDIAKVREQWYWNLDDLLREEFNITIRQLKVLLEEVK